MKPTDDGLKQRLIGAVVLLALAVIFLPVLFHRDHLEPVSSVTQIPPEPEIKSVNIEPPSKPEVVDLAPEPRVMYTPNEAQQATVEPESMGLTPAGQVKSWVLQVASFREASHAKALTQKLLKAGYTAYSRQSQYKNGSVVRVYIGPKLDKSELVKIKEDVDAAYDVSSMVLEFKAK